MNYQSHLFQYPDGYLEANSNKENAESSKTKRKNSAAAGPKPKKIKLIPFELSAELEELIKADDGNTGYWNECAELLKKGKQYYLNIVKETFLCVCCQDLVFNPVTTVCKHNICKVLLPFTSVNLIYSWFAFVAELFAKIIRLPIVQLPVLSYRVGRIL